ncbi:reverse transcriptase domain-containing protein [Tanacetum coccineum]
MTTIFHDMVEDFMEVFMDDFSVFGNSFDCCLDNLDRMLARCIEVDRAKIDVIARFPYPTNVKGVRSFLGHAGSYRFDIEIKDKKGTKNLATDHLLRLENPDLGAFTKDEITDEFPDEHLMILKVELNDNEPWLCLDNVMRRCIAGNKILEILAHYHSGSTRGHHSASITGRKVYESGFFWPSIFKDTKDYVMRYDACQRSGNISSRSEMPQNNIQVCDVFDIWGLDFMGPFPNSRGKPQIKCGHGPNVVKTVYLYGTVEITDENKISFKVNGQRLKKYYDRHIDTDDKEDLAAKKSTMLVKYVQSGNLEVLES